MAEENAGAAIASDTAQPQADATTVEGILNSANANENPENQDDSQINNDPPPAEDPWPKKAQNALSRRDKQIGRLRAELEAARQEAAKYREPSMQQPQSNNQGGQLSPAKTGIPTKLREADFSNYADFMEARQLEIADFRIEQKLAERDGKQKETETHIREQAWESERATVADNQADAFLKEHPDAQALYDEYADTIREFPKQIKHALLAADDVPLAMYNLAKDGKLEDLASMSLVDAKVEIRLAQIKQPEKPKTKAPAPLTASRGSVAPSKSYEKFTPKEAWNLLNPKD